MIFYKDEQFGFYEIFNEENGTLIRSDVCGVDPICRSFPELLDVGIMGHCDSRYDCKLAGIDCYQKGDSIATPHMTSSDFDLIARQAAGKTFQIALGGAGDPNKHPEFQKILRICKHYRIVPNLTTSGYGLTDNEIQNIKEYCGAVAVSWYSRIIGGRESNTATIEAVNRLVKEGCTTNIHYVISNQTIDEAIYRLENDLFPQGINAVIFILYKPVGYGRKDKVVSQSELLKKFLRLAVKKHRFRVGFDTCFTPAVLRFCMDDIPVNCIDACEAGTFSMYIESQLIAYPCSFGIDYKVNGISLKDNTIRDVWNSELFSQLRKSGDKRCFGCEDKLYCLGGCKLGLDINLCKGLKEDNKKFFLK